MKNTPARFPDPPSVKNDWRSSRGFQMASPKMTVEDEETIMPTKDVMAKPTGIVMSCDQKASLGFRAKRAKSGSLTMRVAKLAMEDIIPVTIPQPSALPWLVFFCLTIGPRPFARTIAQMKNARPATGTTYALTVNK